jgi:hypothetical protein
MDTADNLRDMMNNANVAQAAATMALNDKPERMTLNMTLNNETLDTAERKRSEALAPSEALTDKVRNSDRVVEEQLISASNPQVCNPVGC